MAGDRAEDEPEESRKATVLTKFWKEWDKDGNCRILACSAVRGAVIRGKWDTKLRLYPFAAFRWERRRNCAYGESEVTYLIPNQIAINRTLTANVWAVMMLGMPLTVVNTDVVQQRLTNDPGQILEVSGTAEELAGAGAGMSIRPTFRPPSTTTSPPSSATPSPSRGPTTRRWAIYARQHLRDRGCPGGGDHAHADGAEPLLFLRRGHCADLGRYVGDLLREAEPQDRGRERRVVSAL